MKLTAESFLTVVKRSELVEPERLKRLVGEFCSEGVDVKDTQAIAAALVRRDVLTDWQADKLLQGKSRGFFLGKYRLLSLLGKGGMSSVYLAEHVLMRRRCAVKVLPQKRVHDSSYLGRFHREAQAVASLDHPNIVRAYDVDVDRSIEKNHEIHFLVMEYVEGRNLQDLVQGDGVQDQVRTADFLRQAADGLEHAHQAGMVHRDIKPGNLLVDNNGVVRILDLGLARFFDDQDEESLTVAHDEKVLGTADYLAPEQALDSHKVDARADIYSLGCTAYFLLTGHPPFTQGTLAQRLMAHQTKEPPAIDSERAGVSDGLLAIIRRMMAKNPDDRQQTAAAVAHEMAGWLQSEGGADWNLRHPNLAGSGSGNVPSSVSAAASDTDNLMESPTTTPAPTSGDDNLAAFLTKLESDPSIDVVSPSGIASKRGSRKPDRKEPAAIGSAIDEVSSSRSGIATSSPGVQKPRSAVPAMRHVESRPKTIPPIPVSHPVTAPAVSQETVQQPSGSSLTNTLSSLGQNKRVRIAAVAVAAVVLLGGIGWGIAALVSGPGDDSDTPKQVDTGKSDGGTQAKGNTPSGEILVDPDGKMNSIGQALAEVRKRYDEIGNRKPQTLVVRLRGGKTYKDRITLDNSDSSLDNLTLKIVCSDSKPAILAPTGPEPVVRLVNVQHFSLEGVHIQADKTKTAVELTGSCYGLRLQRLAITGFTETGVLATGLKGFPGATFDINLRQLRLDGEGGNAVGLRFSGESSWVTVAGCRFLGPLAAGILFQNDSVDTAIQHCVFHGLSDGIQFLGRLRLRNFAIRHNTFHASNTGVVFTGLPVEGTADLVLSNNLFAKLKTADAVIRGNFKPEDFRKLLPSDGSGLTGNMTDRAKHIKTDIPFLFDGDKTAVVLKFASTKPDDENFLLPTRDASHKTAGAYKVPE